MKKLIYFLFFISFASLGQVSPKSKGQTSSISVKGNYNIIKVIQGDGIKIYDLKDETQYKSFMSYLKAIPQISKELKQVLAFDKKTFELVSKLVERTQEFGIFDPSKFLEEFAKKVEEITKLKQENEALRKQTKDEEFAQILKKANKLLETFDSKGYQRILEDFKKKRKEELIKEQNEIAELAFLLGKNSKINYEFDKAIVQLNEALTLFPNNILYLNEIASTFNLKGDFEKSLEYYQRSLNVFENSFGIDHYGISVIYNNIGSVYFAKDEFDKAMEYFQKSLKIDEVSNSSLLFTNYNNIGLIHKSKGNYEKAIEFLKKGLEMQEYIFGIENEKTATLLNNIGLVYTSKGDYENGLEYLYKGMKINEKFLGIEHISTGTSYNCIGVAYSEKGDNEKGLKYCIKGMLIKEAKLGLNHPSTADSYSCIGGIYDNLKNYEKALEYYQKALIIRKNIFGIESIPTANSYYNLASIYNNIGDFQTALNYCLDANTIFEKKLGKENSNAESLFLDIGFIYIAKGKKDEGLVYINQTQFSKKNNYNKVKFLNDIGVKTFKRENYQASINFYNLALEFLDESKESFTNDMYIILYNNLAKAYCYCGNKEKAFSLFEKSITLGKQINFNLEKILNNYEVCKMKL